MRSLLLVVTLLAQTPNPAQVQTGTVTGRLLALNGTPAAGIRVSAMPAADPAKPSGTNSSDGTVLTSLTQTDAAGRYRLENLPAGRYYILAGFVDAPTYYPGVTATATATSVAVTARATVTGIDFQAARSSTGLSLSGRLKRDSNEGVGGLNIFLSGNDQYPNIRSMPDGTFEFSKLRPGTYSISVSTPNFPPQQIVLADKDISGMDFVIPWTVDVTGNVSVEGGGIRPNLTLTFAGGPRGISSTTARDSFRTTLPEGAYAIAVNGLPSGFFVKSIKSGSIDLQTEPLKLSRTSPPPAIAITLGVSSPPPWVKLSGRVTGLPNPGTSQTRLSLNGPIADSLNVVLGADGSFEFLKLLPGNYSVSITPTSIAIPPVAIIVPNFDLNGVLISFPAVREITGQISVEDGGPIPATSLSLVGTFGLTLDTSPPTLAQLLVGASQPRNSVYVNINLQQDGTFKAALPEGQYRITAMPQFRNASGSVYAVKAFTYGTTDLTKDAVSVSSTDTASLKLTFGPTTPVTWLKVTGRVTGIDSSSLAVNSLTVTLNGSGLLTSWTSTVKPDGSFEFPKVYPGTYTARITAPNTGSAGNLNFGMATTTINLAGTDVTGIEIAVPRQKDITGRVTLEGRGPMPRFGMPLAPLPGTPNSQIQFLNINPQPDGTFRVTIPEGERQIGAAGNLPAGYTLKSMTYGTTDVLKSPLKVAVSDSAELRVTLTTPNLAPVRVSGKLTGVDDSAFARGFAIAILSGSGYIAQLTVPINADRSFQFPEVFPGNYSVRVTGSGILNSPIVPVIVASVDVENIEVAVPRQKEVTGRLILEGSGPMARMVIGLSPLAGGPTSGIGLPQGATAGLPGGPPSTMNINPQPDGTFRLTLLEGEQRVGPVSGLPPGYTLKSLTYGATDLLKNPLKVAASDSFEIRAVVTTSNPTPVRVSGRVIGLDGASFARGPVNAIMTSTMYPVTLNAAVHTDGTFEFPSVYPGSFVLRALGPAVLNSPNLTVTVTNADVLNLEIRVPNLKDITGHLVIEGGGPYPLFALPLASLPASFASPGISGTLPTIRPGADGTFHIGLPEGESRVTNFIGLPPGYTVKSFSYGSTDLLKGPLKVTLADAAEFQITLVNTATPVKVSGRVDSVDLNALAANPIRVTMIGSFVVPITADVRADGSFEFPRVYPGNYRVSAAPRSAQILPVGIPLVVADKEIAGVVVTIPK